MFAAVRLWSFTYLIEKDNISLKSIPTTHSSLIERVLRKRFPLYVNLAHSFIKYMHGSSSRNPGLGHPAGIARTDLQFLGRMDENIRIREKIRERSVDFFSFVRFGRILVDPSSCVFVSYSRLQFSELPCSVQIQVTRSGQIADPSTFRQVGEISRPGRGVEIVVDE